MLSIIFCGDIRYCPYLLRYIERLELHNTKYEVLFWNRGSLALKLPSNYKYYDKPSPESLGKVYKLIDFLGFRRWIKQQLRKSKADSIILLSTLSGVLLFDVTKKFKKKYIFDIRDYSYENLFLFRIIENTLIKDSFFTAISSKGFKSFLPKYDYVIAHNFNRKDINNNHFSKKEEPYQIVWNGTVRFFDYQKKFLDVFKNDSRFVLVYHGTGTDLEKYKEYCKKNDISNVRFTGAYDNSGKAQLLKDAAILNNCYGGRDGDQLRYAISNRYYDGIIFKIPQIVESGGYKASVTENNNVGVSVEPDVGLPDRIYDYYQNINTHIFETSCRNALSEILKEDDNYISKIDSFIFHCEEGDQR